MAQTLYLSVVEALSIQCSVDDYVFQGVPAERVALLGRVMLLKARGTRRAVCGGGTDHGEVLLRRHLAAARVCPFCSDATKACLPAAAAEARASGSLEIFCRDFAVDDGTGRARCEHACCACARAEAAADDEPRCDQGALVFAVCEPTRPFRGGLAFQALRIRVCHAADDEAEAALWWLRRRDARAVS